MKRKFIMLAVSSSLVAAISGAGAQHTVVTDQDLMDKLKDTAPEKIYPGQHEAIIEPELWQAVQDRLAIRLPTLSMSYW